MKTIYIVRVNDYECQAVFDEYSKMLDCWSLNDANWRGEYFNYFMERLDIIVKPRNATEQERKQIAKVMGY
jgi:hypothetical protein